LVGDGASALLRGKKGAGYAEPPRFPQSITAPRHPQPSSPSKSAMFSHIVIFWANPDKPNATEEILAGAEKYLRPVPGVRLFH